MARLPRLSIFGEPHLVVQRARRAVFAVEADHLHYLDELRAAASEFGIAVHGYVLLPDSAFLLATPARSGAVGRLMQKLGRGHSRYFNEGNGGTGTVWQGRYRATVVEAEHFLLDSLRYLESAPVRLGMALRPEEWRWSSAAHHAGRVDDSLITEHAMYWNLGNTPFARQAAYRQLIDEALPAEKSELINRAVSGGWALGSEAYVAMLAQSTKRPLAPRRPGRKPPAD